VGWIDYCPTTALIIAHIGLVTRPQANFFYIYGWLIKIYGCLSAKPENCGEGIFGKKFQQFTKFMANFQLS